MDLGRPALVHATRQHSIAIQVPRWFLDEALPPVAIHGPLPRTAATSLLVDYVTDLVARAPDLPEGGEALLARTVRDLLAVALAGLPPRAALSPGATAGRQRVRAYMETCPMGALDIDAMCRALGLTRSSLYRMFSRDGGVLAYDRRRRLVALHRRLADPQEHASLAELGFAHGFPGRTHLSQVFRETFGYTASELRSHALGQAPNRPLTGSAQDLYRQALRSLA
jgi:AraC-like DNA-binding protein